MIATLTYSEITTTKRFYGDGTSDWSDGEWTGGWTTNVRDDVSTIPWVTPVTENEQVRIQRHKMQLRLMELGVYRDYGIIQPESIMLKLHKRKRRTNPPIVLSRPPKGR